MRILISTIFITILCSCSNPSESTSFDSAYDRFEMFSDQTPQIAIHMKKHFIGYFIDISFGSEFGDQTRVSKKWNDSMKIFIEGIADETMISELDNIISELNSYFTDGFEMILVDTKDESNFEIFFGTAKSYADKHPFLTELIKANKGLFTFFYDEEFNIHKGHMYVDTERSLIDEQKHILREELTQALGLGNDIPYYPNSIFYKDESKIDTYSELDVYVIKLLYHPAIVAGLGEESIQNVLETLLGV